MMVIDRTKGDECMKKRMIVFGGTGVFGQAFIPLALAQGYQVTSVSPSGTPKEFATWQAEVEWRCADVLTSTKWHQWIETADILVDAIGIIQEKPKQARTYQRFNAETAEILAREGKKADVSVFVYLSAQPFTTLLLKKYFQSKKMAEEKIQRFYPKAIIVRPSLLVNKTRKLTFVFLALGPFIRLLFPTFRPALVEDVAKEVLQQIQKQVRDTKSLH